MPSSQPDPGEPPFLAQGCASPWPRAEVLKQRLWQLVETLLFRPTPEKCHHWRALLLKLFGADIPEPGKVVIFPSATVYFPAKLRLEPRAMIGRRVRLYNLAPITLRRGANISQGCHLCAGTHDFTRWEMPLVTAPIEIGPNAWLAADVFVGPGVTIGELAVIGARSVVVRDQPPRTVCAGHPCRPLHPRPGPTL
ncbi:putative colanic acid biosynthesis acetyltransferase [Opitutaceae bacterium TAV4]|uniref:putative colanic acid biosynthesis acetyltransferase n=1 Tax=Geminisphaera colitermitum TaxID=1148786 RepID=UPI000158D5E5|nr:putative colanic acid biosynthesis acetyltransferase [Geminisphaera colitermitum]RRJ96683.1 putative colanic acid biosynthesis acetyltransferase [Opitutaceae bacterium TAV4]RRK00733.1 putative colanic acid biosynthesis acetyltransferase [Opitutaceae bacterium TAV3]